mgnify:CR=1 FL=1
MNRQIETRIESEIVDPVPSVALSLYDLKVIADFRERIAEETDWINLRQFYSPEMLLGISDSAKRLINEAKQRRIDELKMGYE